MQLKKSCCKRVFIRADAIVLGSPTYFADVTADMKALLDRAGFVGLANDNALRGKIGAAVVANRRGVPFMPTIPSTTCSRSTR